MKTRFVPTSQKYVTLEEGMDYRTISNLMTEAGWKMNHATVRDIFMSAMSKIVKDVIVRLDIQLSEDELYDVLKSNSMHRALQDILEELYDENGKLIAAE